MKKLSYHGSLRLARLLVEKGVNARASNDGVVIMEGDPQPGFGPIHGTILEIITTVERGNEKLMEVITLNRMVS